MANTGQYSFPSSTGQVTSTYNRYTSTERQTPSPKPSGNELRPAVSTRQDMEPSMGTYNELSELSDLRKLLDVASELQKIDLGTALKAYKELMKQTRHEDRVNMEEKLLETRRDRLEQVTSQTNTNGRREHEALVQMNEKLQTEKKELESKYLQNKIMFEDMEMENKKQKAAMQRKEDELMKVKKEKDVALVEKSEALTRLSKEMGTKLSDNNADIADLSDPNRAMKLGEKYSEIYDNEWTDALEKLGDGGLDEETSIKVLIDVLKKCYKVCVDISEKQMVSLQMALVNPAIPPKQAWGDGFNPVVPKSTLQQLKGCRKEVSPNFAVDNITEHTIKLCGQKAETIPNFVKRCVGLCWLMCLHDPPVVIGGEATVDETFDTNRYRTYTNSGTVVSYNVWPPLLLQENGAILVKGVVQPVKVERKKEVPKTVMPTTSRSDYSKTYHAPPSTVSTPFPAHDHYPTHRQPAPVTKEVLPQTKDAWKDFDPITGRERHTTTTTQYPSKSTTDTQSQYPYHQQTTTTYTNPHPGLNNQQSGVVQQQVPQYYIGMHLGRQSAFYNGKWYDLIAFRKHFGI